MMRENGLWVVIPAYNEGPAIAAVVAGLRRLGYGRICVVDDGSGDSTAACAAGAGAHVLRHVVNLGQGAALQTGIDYVLMRDADFVCTFDADGQHVPESLETMLEALHQTGADVVLASRFLGRAVDMPASRRMLLKAALLFTRLHARLPVTDTHNGLRLFTRRAAQTIHIHEPGMAHASEILHQIGRAKLRFVEVPVTIYYTEYTRRKGQSGFESVKVLLDLLYRSVSSHR